MHKYIKGDDRKYKKMTAVKPSYISTQIIVNTTSLASDSSIRDQLLMK